MGEVAGAGEVHGDVGGLGGVGINLVLRASYQSSGTATIAFWVFGAFYVVAALVTWKVYVRTPAPRGHGTLEYTSRDGALTVADTR